MTAKQPTMKKAAGRRNSCTTRFNLKYMRVFAEAWPEIGIGQQPAGQLESGAISQAVLGQLGGGDVVQQPVALIVQQLLEKLPWGHHCVLFDKLKTREERRWYAAKVIENNWSRNILYTSEDGAQPQEATVKESLTVQFEGPREIEQRKEQLKK